MKKIRSFIKKVKPGTGRTRRKFRQISYEFFRLPTLLAVLFAIFIVVFFKANKWIRSAVEIMVPTPVAEKYMPKTPQHTLILDDPEKYHMQKYKPGDLTLTQHDWNSWVEQLTLGTKRVPKTKKEEVALLRRIQALDRQIKYTEKISRRSPTDYKIKEDLQQLYMLRATLAAMK